MTKVQHLRSTFNTSLLGLSWPIIGAMLGDVGAIFRDRGAQLGNLVAITHDLGAQLGDLGARIRDLGA